MYSVAVSPAVSVLLQGDRCTCLENWSKVTKMELKPYEIGKSTMSSLVTICQGPSGVSFGCSGPCDCAGKIFLRLQILQVSMYLLTNLVMPGHQ